MKKVLTRILGISSLALLMLTACKKNDALTTASLDKAGSLTASTTAPAIELAKVKDTTAIIKFGFTASDYNAKIVETNTLQIDADGDNWKNPASFALPKGTLSQSFSTAAFDGLLLKVATPGTSTKVNIRVQHALSGTTNTYSNVIGLTVTPINLTSWLYVPGDYEGWKNDANPANAPNEDSLVSVTGNGIYTGIIDFRGYAGSTGSLQFKIVPVKGDWTHSYGTFDSGTNTTIVLDGTNDGNLWVPTAAPYLVTVNLNNNTISAVPANYYSVIGDAAQGWGTDVPMKYINDGNGVWAVTLPLVSTGSFKMRENNDWTYSWGIPQAGQAGDGVANTLNDTKNNNISITTSGNYKVTLNYPATVASSTFVPAVTLTYTVTKQ